MEKKYKVEVWESLVRVVEVSALNEADAIAKTEAMYNRSEIVLDSNDFDGEPQFNIINEDENI